MTTQSDTKADVYMFTGETDVRRESELERLIEKALDAAFADFDLERFDGNNTSGEAVVMAAMTAPLGSGKKVVIVDRVDKLRPEEQLYLAEFIPKLSQNTCLILLSTDEFSAKQKKESKAGSKDFEDIGLEADGTSGRRRKGLQPELLKTVREHGKVYNFTKMKPDDIRIVVQDLLKEYGLQIQPTALQSLVQALESNPSVLSKEIEKLATYMGEQKTITSSDIESVITQTMEDRVFRVIDAIATRRPDQALKYLSETFSVSTRPDDEVTRILALIGRHFRSLYQVRFLKEQGVRMPQSIPEDLQGMMMEDGNPLDAPDWQRRKLSQQADMFTLNDLRDCLSSVLACELAVKGIGNATSSQRLSLEMLVLKLSQMRAKIGG